jgi:hypothetical protein
MQELKIVMNQVLPFIKTIYEKAQIENIDLNTAVYQTIQEIRLYFQMSGLQKGVQSLESRIAILNMVAMQKEQALSILYELQNRGVSIVQDFGIGSILQT